MKLNSGFGMELVVDGQIHGAEINDNILRDTVKRLRSDDLLILRGDRQNSLMPRSDPKKIHD